ncbi:MAG: hypothetical protein CENE_01771 [Candidatus Celerinatantimonas neptuna]|nr:MAG: hypothetical protein CENE_01771 [Candidatus Celerinatantimonas neptuna]
MPNTRSQWAVLIITALISLSAGYWAGTPAANASAEQVAQTQTQALWSDQMANQAQQLIDHYRQHCQHNGPSCKLRREAFSTLLPAFNGYCQQNQARACVIGSEIRDIMVGYQALDKRS